MPRECKKRRVLGIPSCHNFVPSTPLSKEVILMGIDEYETIRCIDYEKMTQEECANHMGVARTTVQAIYESARHKLSDFLINPKQLHIDGGEYFLCDGINEKCPRPDCPRHKMV